ncbi:MAG: hypothetical protein R3C54_02635 [Parvularculaceae bacterium]
MSEENDSAQERSHAPTQQSSNGHEKEGDVPYSSEVTVAATYGAFYTVIVIAGGWTP